MSFTGVKAPLASKSILWRASSPARNISSPCCSALGKMLLSQAGSVLRGLRGLFENVGWS